MYLGVVAVAMPVLCLVVGFWTVWMRARDGVAWLLLAMMASFAHGLDLGEYAGGSIGMRVLHSFLALAWPVEQRWPWLKYLIFGPMIGMAAAMAMIPYLSYTDSMERGGILDWLLGLQMFCLS